MRRMTLEAVRLGLDNHVQGTWLDTRAAAAVMRERASVSIVKMSSISDKAGNLG